MQAAWGSGQGQLEGEAASRVVSLARTPSMLGGRPLWAEAEAQVGQGDGPPCRGAWSLGSPPEPGREQVTRHRQPHVATALFSRQ